MDYVEGTGIRDGEQMTVTIYKDSNGYHVVAPGRYEAEIIVMLRGPLLIGGTYPAPEGSLLKAYYTMEKFFAGKWEASVSGEPEEIPSEPGVIY